MLQRLYIRLALGLVCLPGAALPAAAWTPVTQVTIAREAARLSPPDLARQIEKHRRAYEEGVKAPFSDADPGRHMKNPDGSGQLDRAALDAVEAAVAAIRGHQPFEEIVRRLGRGRRRGPLLRRLSALRRDRRAAVPARLLRRAAGAGVAAGPLAADRRRAAPRPRDLSHDRPRVPAHRLRLRPRPLRRPLDGVRCRLSRLQPRGDGRDARPALYLDHGRR